MIDESRGPDGALFSATFELEGVQFMALNADPIFEFNEAVSFFVSCKDQREVDEYWNKFLAGGGKEGNCGWLKDKWGVSWQIVPTRLGELLGDEDPEKAQRVMQAMLKMRKIDVHGLERAYAGT